MSEKSPEESRAGQMRGSYLALLVTCCVAIGTAVDKNTLTELEEEESLLPNTTYDWYGSSFAIANYTSWLIAGFVNDHKLHSFCKGEEDSACATPVSMVTPPLPFIPAALEIDLQSKFEFGEKDKGLSGYLRFWDEWSSRRCRVVAEPTGEGVSIKAGNAAIGFRGTESTRPIYTKTQPNQLIACQSSAPSAVASACSVLRTPGVIRVSASNDEEVFFGVHMAPCPRAVTDIVDKFPKIGPSNARVPTLGEFLNSHFGASLKTTEFTWTQVPRVREIDATHHKEDPSSSGKSLLEDLTYVRGQIAKERASAEHSESEILGVRVPKSRLSDAIAVVLLTLMLHMSTLALGIGHVPEKVPRSMAWNVMSAALLLVSAIAFPGIALWVAIGAWAGVAYVLLAILAYFTTKTGRRVAQIGRAVIF